MAATERLGQSKPSRPSVVSQHSNSVPSTPAQHPRDIRFPSRSPSPSHGLSNPSPRSTISETPIQTSTQRGAPVVCKFETGAEFRKRRIPYKDGGNEPLPPPKTEPKKSLEPHEDDKLSGDMRELYDRLLPSEESELRRTKLVVKLEAILQDAWPGNDIKVNVFGSSGNLLSSTDSDVDLCLTTTLKNLESMHSLATVLHDHGMEKVVCRASARVPIVKFWDSELQLACDMNANNPLALENTRMIKTYVQIDERVRPLAKIIKHWTKRRLLNDAAFGGTISSYTWICMAINFLQSRQPPILPSLQKAPHSQRLVTNGQVSQFADDLDQVRGYGETNKETLGQLLFDFFRFYGYEIDYQEFVVSVKEGRVLTRKEKGWDASNYHNKEARSRLCVEEPFNNSRNLGNSADDYAFSGIHQEIRRAFDLIAEGKLDECCEQYEFPPEEKPLFQRPPPKPKPVLTRSASQSGRPHAGSIGAKGNRESRNNRNTSNHRSGNRRASSGAAYGNQRYGYMSPPVGVVCPDYFAAAGIPQEQLHEQLYKQYQFLQNQQEALRNQLVQQQRAHAQAQIQVQVHGQPQISGQPQYNQIDLAAASPRQRTFVNSLPSPRVLENSASTTPLLPGYLYHYPARYPVPLSPLTQTRTHDSHISNPSSPLNTSMPSSRRGNQRSAVHEQGSAGSARSQSQPGRSFPNAVTLQSLAHPGYDVSGAIPAPYLIQYPMHMYGQRQTGTEPPKGIQTGLTRNGLSLDTPMPKEYVGYYVGQSPQLGPQYPMNSPPVAPILNDPPSMSHKRLSPERLPPILPNGMRRNSRSPSPLSRGGSSPASSNSHSAPLPQMPFPEAKRHVARSEDGPIIVNGSTPSLQPPAIVRSTPLPKRQVDEAVHGLGFGPGEYVLTAEPEAIMTSRPTDETVSNGHRASLDNPDELADASILSNKYRTSNEHTAHTSQELSPHASPTTRAKPPSRLSLSPKEQMTQEISVGHAEKIPDIRPFMAPPILSPVAELRTPSPTSSKGQSSPKRDVALMNAQIANMALNEKASATIANGISQHSLESTTQGHVAPSSNVPKPAVHNSVSQAGQWQQATRKGHKKAKSNGSSRGVNELRPGGEPMPVNEADRKGG